GAGLLQDAGEGGGRLLGGHGLKGDRGGQAEGGRVHAAVGGDQRPGVGGDGAVHGVAGEVGVGLLRRIVEGDAAGALGAAHVAVADEVHVGHGVGVGVVAGVGGQPVVDDVVAEVEGDARGVEGDPLVVARPWHARAEVGVEVVVVRHLVAAAAADQGP